MDLERVSGLHQYFASTLELLPNFHPQRKFDSILPYFHGENLAAFRVRCIVARITLSLPSFLDENKARRCHIFTTKMQQSFTLGVPQHTSRVSCLCIQHAEAYQSTKHVMHVVYTGKPMSLANIDRSNHTRSRSCTQ